MSAFISNDQQTSGLSTHWTPWMRCTSGLYPPLPAVPLSFPLPPLLPFPKINLHQEWVSFQSSALQSMASRPVPRFGCTPWVASPRHATRGENERGCSALHRLPALVATGALLLTSSLCFFTFSFFCIFCTSWLWTNNSNSDKKIHNLQRKNTTCLFLLFIPVMLSL